MKKNTKATSTPIRLSAEEQHLWDNVVLSLISQGKDSSHASAEAHRIIRGRRGKQP